jgi:hypothetical protein
MTLAITSYQVFLSIHILCAVLWVGAGFSFVVTYARVSAATEPAMVARFMHVNEFIGSRIFAPLSLTLVIMGFILMGKGDWPYDFWVIFGLVVWVLSFLNGIGYLGRNAGPIAGRLEAEGYTPDVARDFRNWLLAGRIEVTLLMLVVLDMALKPGA